MEKETKKEIGKWLMDIAKYLLTAVFFTSIFKQMPQYLMATACMVIVVLLFYIGVRLYNRNTKKIKWWTLL